MSAHWFNAGFEAARVMAHDLVAGLAQEQDWRSEEARIAGVKPARPIRLLRRAALDIRSMARPAPSAETEDQKPMRQDRVAAFCDWLETIPPPFHEHPDFDQFADLTDGEILAAQTEMLRRAEAHMGEAAEVRALRELAQRGRR